MSEFGALHEPALAAAERRDMAWFAAYYSHRADDMFRLATNLGAGAVLCERCDGTGNELLSMYRRCSACAGSGSAPILAAKTASEEAVS